MKIAIYNHKGGVGKTTTAINLAYSLTKFNPECKVLFADCDKQQNAARFFCEKAASGISESRYKGISVISVADPAELPVSSEEYDFMLLDMPPALDSRTETLLAAADSVIVPVELGSFAVQGIADVTAAISRSETVFLGALVTRFDRKNSADVEMLDLIRQQLGAKVFDTIIPQSKIICNSINYRMTAAEYMGWLEPAKCFDRLAAEVIRKGTAIC